MTGSKLAAALRKTARAYERQAESSDYLSDTQALERGAASIRLVAVLVREGIYDYDLGNAWLRAAHVVLGKVQTSREQHA